MVASGSYEPDRVPIILGHEFVGVVEEVGAASDAPEAGARVVAEASWRCGRCTACLAGTSPCSSPIGLGRSVDGCFATDVVLPMAALHPVPPQVSDRAAQAFVSVGTALKAAALALQRTPTDVVLIGSGHGALLILQILVHRGIEVSVAGTRNHRLGLARRFGAVDTLDLRDPHDRERFELANRHRGSAEVTVEATGAGEGLGRALAATRPGGTVVAYSIYRDSDVVPHLDLLYQRGLTVVGSRGGASYWDEALRLLGEGRVDPVPLTREPVGLDDVPATFSLMSSKSIDAPRVLIDPRIEGSTTRSEEP